MPEHKIKIATIELILHFITLFVFLYFANSNLFFENSPVYKYVSIIIDKFTSIPVYAAGIF